MTTRWRPTLTPEQYREASLLFRVEVANIAWSLVVSPAPVGEPRQWRALTSEETADVFERLIAACSRHALKDKARLEDRAR